MSSVVMLKCRSSVTEPNGCQNIAKALILIERDLVAEGAHGERLDYVALEAMPVCADHAPEEAHEMASCSNEDEYLIVELPAFGVGRLT